MTLAKYLPSQAAPWLEFAERCLAGGDHDGAEGGLRMAVALDPANALAWTGLAKLAIGRADHVAAARLLKRALDADLEEAARVLSLREQFRLSLLL